MNTLVEQGTVTEMSCGANFAYILSDNSFFLPTEYKVLQSRSGDCFVKCMRMLYNGKVALYYMTGAYKPMSEILPSIDAERFVTVTANILADIIEVNENGFLSCRNVDISFEHIYIDPATYKVSLIYLPLSRHMFSEYSVFESELRTGLIKLISGLDMLSSPRMTQLSADLSNGMMSVGELYAALKGKAGAAPVNSDRRKQAESRPAGYMRIVSLNAPTRVEIQITKDEFVLGRKAGVADGVLSFNDKIGRVHCKINTIGNRHTVTDLHSTNGTFVNKKRLQPEQPCTIKNGDVIRLANSDFQVIEE